MSLELFWKVMHFGPRTTICLKYLEEEKKSSNRVYKLHNAHFLEAKDQQSSKLFEGLTVFSVSKLPYYRTDR
jgi:hypothetical protein